MKVQNSVQIGKAKKLVQNKWWDNDCNIAKQAKYCKLCEYRAKNSQSNFNEYLLLKRSFKNLCRAKQLQSEKCWRDELLRNRTNPKTFWSCIKNANNVHFINSDSDAKNISLSAQWFIYFKTLFKDTYEDKEIEQGIFETLYQYHECELLDSEINNEETYPKQCYIMLKRLDEAGHVTWVTHVKNLLYQYGFGYVWIVNEVGNQALFKQTFTQRLKDCAYQTTFDDIRSSSKSLTYMLYKSALKPESYLSLPLPYMQKCMLSNFHCSSHLLMIEKGRHLGFDCEYRFCAYCHRNSIYVIENEIHFLIACPMYNDTDNYFKQEWLDTDVTEQLFISIMSDSKTDSIFSLSRFLVNAFELRELLNAG